MEMEKPFISIKNLILYDFKKLVVIEAMIKIIGFLIIYPLFRIAFFYSLQLSGLKYISNSDLIFYLKQPTTIIMALLLVFIFAIYLLLEYVFLALLYEHAINNKIIYYKSFFIKGFMRFFYVLGRYHFFILMPILLFFILFEYIQISIFSSTIKLPNSVIVELQSFQPSIGSLVLFSLFYSSSLLNL